MKKASKLGICADLKGNLRFWGVMDDMEVDQGSQPGTVQIQLKDIQQSQAQSPEPLIASFSEPDSTSA